MLAVAAMVLGACSNDDHAGSRRAAARSGVVVASFNFTESELLAEMYSQVLSDRGVPVRRELSLGTREMVLPALEQGLVDIVPEYVGSATAAMLRDPSADPHDATAVRAELAAALARWHVEPLALAPATNVNGVVITRDTARRFGIDSISGLRLFAPQLSLGGPPECPTRPYCLLGLRDRYGLRFQSFVAVDGQDRIFRAVADGVIDVGMMFTTDGRLASRDLVLLTDDQHLQPADNIVPLVRDSVRERYGARATDALNAVSERLTTDTLRFLNWRIDVAGNTPHAEARAWLLREHLIQRGR